MKYSQKSLASEMTALGVLRAVLSKDLRKMVRSGHTRNPRPDDADVCVRSQRALAAVCEFWRDVNVLLPKRHRWIWDREGRCDCSRRLSL